jgi:hypothetical protein
VGVASLEKNLKWGTKVKFTPPLLDFLRNLRENLKGGTKGYFDLSREKNLKGGTKGNFLV